MISLGRKYRTPAAVEYLERQLHEAGRVELRAIDPDGLVSVGLFDDIELLRVTIHEHRRQANLYGTIQSPKPLPASNRMQRGGRGIRNTDIGHQSIQFAAVGFDPCRSTVSQNHQGKNNG